MMTISLRCDCDSYPGKICRYVRKNISLSSGTGVSHRALKAIENF